MQRPEDALFGDMPSNAMQLVTVDHVESAAGLGALLTRLVSQPAAVPEAGILAELARRLSTRMEGRGLRRTASRFEKAATAAVHDSELIRQLPLSVSADDPVDVTEPETTDSKPVLSRPASGKRSR